MGGAAAVLLDGERGALLSRSTHRSARRGKRYVSLLGKMVYLGRP